MTIATEIEKPVASVFRRAWIKRRSATTALLESGWTEITTYVKSWGSLKKAVDDIRLNRFKYDGIELIVRNDEGKFNIETDINSLWYGYLTRYKTLLKIEAGYIADDGTELPTDASLGVFIVTDEIPISSATNEATIQAKSLASIFDEVRAVNINGLGATLTASDLIARIRDHTDGSSNYIFRDFITSTSWVIQTTTSNYNFATSSAYQDKSAWDLMAQLAESEGFIVVLNRSGGIEFRDRDERTTTSAFDFYGQTYANPSIISLNEYKQAMDKYYNYFVMKYQDADTNTSYLTAGTLASVSPSVLQWKYGQRTYNFENTWAVNTATAQTLVNNLYNEFSELKNELNITCKLIPQLEISDKVTVSYRSYSAEGFTQWDGFDWDGANWADEKGENFDWNLLPFKVLSIETDLENFTTTFQLRGI